MKNLALRLFVFLLFAALQSLAVAAPPYVGAAWYDKHSPYEGAGDVLYTYGDFTDLFPPLPLEKDDYAAKNNEYANQLSDLVSIWGPEIHMMGNTLGTYIAWDSLHNCLEPDPSNSALPDVSSSALSDAYIACVKQSESVVTPYEGEIFQALRWGQLMANMNSAYNSDINRGQKKLLMLWTGGSVRGSWVISETTKILYLTRFNVCVNSGFELTPLEPDAEHIECAKNLYKAYAYFMTRVFSEGGRRLDYVIPWAESVHLEGGDSSKDINRVKYLAMVEGIREAEKDLLGAYNPNDPAIKVIFEIMGSATSDYKEVVQLLNFDPNHELDYEDPTNPGQMIVHSYRNLTSEGVYYVDEAAIGKPFDILSVSYTNIMNRMGLLDPGSVYYKRTIKNELLDQDNCVMSDGEEVCSAHFWKNLACKVLTQVPVAWSMPIATTGTGRVSADFAMSDDPDERRSSELQSVAYLDNLLNNPLSLYSSGIDCTGDGYIIQAGDYNEPYSGDLTKNPFELAHWVNSRDLFVLMSEHEIQYSDVAAVTSPFYGPRAKLLARWMDHKRKGGGFNYVDQIKCADIGVGNCISDNNDTDHDGRPSFVAMSGNDTMIQFTNRSGGFGTVTYTGTQLEPQINTHLQTDKSDNCPLDFNPFQADYDGDGIGNSCDNCPSSANPNQEDADADGLGNLCDGSTIFQDTDCDGFSDFAELSQFTNPRIVEASRTADCGVDTDDDGIGNNADTDDDGDGAPDINDDFPLDASESFDTDSDGVGNNADTDDDGDGIGDEIEVANGTNPLVRVNKNDFDADYDSDIFWRDSASGTNVVWVMEEGGRTATNVLGSNTTAFTVEGIADFDTDGDDDVLFRNNTTGQSVIWTLQNGVKARTVVLGTNAATYTIKGVADFDADGDADILFRDNAGSNVIWTIQNAAKTGAVVLGANAAAFTVEATKDFDSDGDADILFRNNGTGQSVIWSMQNAAKTGDVVLGTNAAYSINGVADFDADGDADILFRNTSGNNVIWTIEGAAKSGEVVLDDKPVSFGIAATADFDADGDTDILFRDNSTGQNVIWPIQSADNLPESAIGSNTAGFAVSGTADFDGDGDEDILFRNNATGQNVAWIIENNAKVVANVLGSNAATMTPYFEK